jgi:hypothetical protein
MHREEEGRWREGRVGWGRMGRGTEREGNGAEGKKGGKGGGEERERDGREMEGTGIGGEVCVMVFGGDGRPCVYIRNCMLKRCISNALLYLNCKSARVSERFNTARNRIECF